MFDSLFQKEKKRNSNSGSKLNQSYLCNLNGAIWSDREYTKFAEEAYIKNVIAHRCISLTSQAAASVPFKVLDRDNHVVANHPILNLLNKPNPSMNGKEFMESIYSYRMISGNSYVLGIGGEENSANPRELFALRPDRMSIIPGDNFIPKSYRYQVGSKKFDYQVNPVTGRSNILHLKNFHPLSDWYGLSSIEAAAYSIDLHNQSVEWNQSLLQNGARPSGAIVVQGEKGQPKSLNEEQYVNLKSTIDEIFSGPKNAGRPLLLEGGLDWKEMSLSPKDMDFLQSKHSSARDIALALGVPPQMLGIQGDNTYNNLKEARLAFWEQSVVPLVENVVSHINSWLSPAFNDPITLTYDLDCIPALAEKKQALWAKVDGCSFMTTNEKRSLFNLPPLSEK